MTDAEAVQQLRSLLANALPYLHGYAKLLTHRPEFSAPYLPRVTANIEAALRQHPERKVEPYAPRETLEAIK